MTILIFILKRIGNCLRSRAMSGLERVWAWLIARIQQRRDQTDNEQRD